MRSLRVLGWEDKEGNTQIGIARDDWSKGYPQPEHAVVNGEGEVVWIPHEEGALLDPFLGTPEQLSEVLRAS